MNVLIILSPAVPFKCRRDNIEQQYSNRMNEYGRTTTKYEHKRESVN